MRSDLRFWGHKCPICGQLVYLLRDGSYRRHYTTDSHGRRHLCEASNTPAGEKARALRRADL